MREPLVSVSGVRGVIGESFTEEMVRRWAGAFARLLSSRHPTPGTRTIVMGRDTRPSGAWALDVAARTLAARSARPIVLGIVSTPTVQLAVTHHRAAGGLVITGSHNPSEWNALKFLGPDGVFLSESDINALKERTNRSDENVIGTRPSTGETRTDDDAIGRHIENVLTKLPIDVERIRARAFRVVVDPVNGAGALALPPLLERLGCTVTVINGGPNGQFAHLPEPTQANLTGLGDAVRAARADLGIAVDPDADRLVLVDEKGVVLSEEYTVTLATLSVLQAKSKFQIPNSKFSVVVSLSTTRMVEVVAKQFGATVVRTPVGERHVVEGMRAHGAVVGGEGNGGVILPASHEGRDSLVGAALVLDLLARRSATLTDMVQELPRYAMRKEKLPRGETWDQGEAATALARAFPDSTLSTLDGVRVDTAEGWIHLRLSNTEPVLRLIAEARSEEALTTILARARVAVGERAAP